MIRSSNLEFHTVRELFWSKSKFQLLTNLQFVPSVSGRTNQRHGPALATMPTAEHPERDQGAAIGVDHLTQHGGV